jgi:transposase-like protein
LSWIQKVIAIARRRAMEWKDLTGEERYRIVEMARKGKTPITKICETFGVTRQTLTKAIATAEEAAKMALATKKPGRKEKSEEEKRITELSKTQSSLEKDVEYWKTRYEVAQTYIDVTREEEEQMERNRRKRERQKQKKKKPRKSKGTPKSSRKVSGDGGGTRLAIIDGGADSGNTNGEPEEVEE